MSADRIQIKTRFGQILESIVGRALTHAGVAHRFDWQYDADAIKLDFSIPAGDTPSTLIEVTQTEARNVLQRKLLRYFEQVAQAKVHFGSEVAVVSLIFGLPTRDVPEATLASSLSFFDDFLLPRMASFFTKKQHSILETLEQITLKHASTGPVNENTVNSICEHCPEAIELLGKYCKDTIMKARANKLLGQMWDKERARVGKLKTLPHLPTIKSNHKRDLLKNLFVSSDQIRSLELLLQSAKKLSDGVFRLSNKENLSSLAPFEALGLCDQQLTIGGIKVSFDSSIAETLGDKKKMEVIDALRKELVRTNVHWFFADIQDESRRKKMAEIYLEIVNSGQAAIEDAVYGNLAHSEYCGVKHNRCWIADLMVIHLGTSQNLLNNRISSKAEYVIQTGKPFNDITMKFARIMSNDSSLRLHAKLAAEVWGELPKKTLSSTALAGELKIMRIDGAMYLQKFNPFHLVIEGLMRDHGWKFEYKGVPTILGDLLQNPQVGRFKAYLGKRGQRRIVINGLQIKDAHKPKEWAARGRALRYRIKTEKNGDKQVISQLDGTQFIFVLDGDVSEKMRRQLEWAGWTTCNLEELPSLLD